MNSKHTSRRALLLGLLLNGMAAPLFAQTAERQRGQDSPPREIRRTQRGEARPEPMQPPGGNEVAPRVVPPEQRPGGGWSFGAVTDSTDVGVRVRQVTPRSAAARAGLERDDVIVAVAGYQVGRVDGVEYPLDAELQRRAAQDGRVRLLVQDVRDRKLMNLDVQLDRPDTPGAPPSAGVLRGEASYRERMLLPAGSELRVRLVRRPILGKEVVAQTVVKNITTPTRFELSYDTAKVDPRRTYELEVEIWSGNRKLFQQDGTLKVRPEEGKELRVELRRA